MAGAWIEWFGGGCPVPEGTRIDVEHRDGDIYTDVIVGEDWECSDWTHDPECPDGGEIVAYRQGKP
jgi:hypothetical protein